MWELHRMYSDKFAKDMWWAYNGDDNAEVNYVGPFEYAAEAQQKVDEMNWYLLAAEAQQKADELNGGE